MSTEINPQWFQRIPFDVQAINVTADNIEAVAAWCEGNVENPGRPNAFVRVDVADPRTDRQTKAFLGDWVLKAPKATGISYKVYTDSAFKKCFELKEVVTELEFAAPDDEPLFKDLEFEAATVEAHARPIDERFPTPSLVFSGKGTA